MVVFPYERFDNADKLVKNYLLTKPLFSYLRNNNPPDRVKAVPASNEESQLQIKTVAASGRINYKFIGGMFTLENFSQ